MGNAILIAKSLLVTLAIQDPTSPISKEWRTAEESSSLTGLAWLEAMATTVAEKTSIATLAAALREWQRLLVFLSDHGSLSNKNIKLFIKERATASPGTRGSKRRPRAVGSTPDSLTASMMGNAWRFEFITGKSVIGVET